MTLKPIVLHGNNLDHNRGCQALRVCTCMILDKYLPDYPRVHANLFVNRYPHWLESTECARYSDQVYESDPRTWTFRLWQAQIGLTGLFSFYPPMKVYQNIRKSAALLDVGGDLLGMSWGYDALRLFSGPMNAAVQHSVPCIVWGGSIGPFDGLPKIEKIMLPLLAKSDLLLVREPTTREYLKKNGIEKNVHEVTDCAFLLPVEEVDVPPELESALTTGALGINLAPFLKRKGYANCSPRQLLKKSVQWIIKLRQHTDIPIVLIPHVMEDKYPETFNNDFEYLRQIHDHLPKELRSGVVLYDARQHNCMQIKKVISRLKVFAGTRLHATVASLSSRVPTYTIAFSFKGLGINQAVFGHQRWNALYSDITPERFADDVSRLLHEQNAVRDHLEAFIPEYTKKAWLAGELLAEKVLSYRK